MLMRHFTAILTVLVAIASVIFSQPQAAIAAPGMPAEFASMAALPGFSQMFSGQRPDNLGVKAGKLSSCPTSPNCVSSQASTDDSQHYVEPLSYSATNSDPIATVANLISQMDRTQIITADDTYLYAEFTSSLMGFVDDVEFYLDPDTETIQVRSASRLGESDLGVNRDRIELIRQLLNA